MITKIYSAHWLIAMALILAGGQCLALESQVNLEKRICANLADEAQYVLNDASDTSKYLSPYIAAEIYQQVVNKSLGSDATEQNDVSAPSMAALPCGDTVSGFLMAIKKRMEYNRFDYFVLRYRIWIVSTLMLAMLGGGFYLRNRYALAKQGNTDSAT